MPDRGFESRALRRAREILRIESDAIEGVRASLDGSALAAAARMILAARGKVIVTGVGKSGLIGRKIAATMSSTGTPAVFLHPTEAVQGDLGIVGRGDVILALSHSGEAEEVLQVVEAAKGLKARAIAITGQPGSSLARAAHAVLCVPIRKEACPLGLAPTASTTAALALGDALAMVLMEERGFKSEDFRVFHPGGHLGRRLSARVRDFLRTGRLLPVVPVTATLAQAIKEMSAKESIGVTTIRARDGRLAGILTDGDLRRILRKSPDPKAALRRKAAEFMIRSPKTVDPDAAASEALRIMEVHGITSLVAVDARDRAVGLVHIHDLLGRGKTLI
ncbi:MAG: KpsF/GutQ family sugar-phosphate isomerase [Planctomycetota bacterium]